MPEDKVKKLEKIKEDKQNPEKIDNELNKFQNLKKMSCLILIIWQH